MLPNFSYFLPSLKIKFVKKKYFKFSKRISTILKREIMMRTMMCPNCRHTYENMHSPCVTCLKEKSRNSKPMGISSKPNLPSCASNVKFDFNEFEICSVKQKQQRLQKFLSGGSIVRTDSADKTGREKPKDTGHSPTASLSFIIPPASLFAACDKFRIIDEKLSNSFYTSEKDLHKISESQRLLKQSGWYHPKLTWKSAIELLMPTTLGTFLVRDSSDSNYLYSLSIQTKCGPTSIRIHYSKGEFRLDANHNSATYLPKFPCLIKLIQYYMDLTKHLPLMCKQDDDENHNCVSLFGNIYSQIVITKPLYAKGHIPTLKHLSRLRVMQNLVDPNLRSVLPAPAFVTEYLDQYPYKI